MSKKCAKCQLVLNDNMFYQDQKSSDRLSSYCKSCKKIVRAAYYKANPITGLAWDLAHPKETKDRKLRYRKAHMEAKHHDKTTT